MDETNRLTEEALDAFLALSTTKKGEAGVRMFSTSNNSQNLDSVKAKFKDISF